VEGIGTDRILAGYNKAVPNLTSVVMFSVIRTRQFLGENSATKFRVI